MQPVKTLPGEPFAQDDSWASERSGETWAETGDKELTRSRAVALQHELLVMYRSPLFQKKLKNLPQDEEEHHTAFQKIVRGVQKEVLPKYGFEATDQGVKELHACFELFRDDPVVSAMSTSIVQILSSGCEKAQEDPIKRTEDSSKDRKKGALPGLGPMPSLMTLWINKMNNQMKQANFEANEWRYTKADDWQPAPPSWQSTPTYWENSSSDWQSEDGQSDYWQADYAEPDFWQPGKALMEESLEEAAEEVPACEEEHQDIPLTKARAEYALAELAGQFSSKSFRKKVEMLDDGKQPPVTLRYTKNGCLDAPLSSGVNELAQRIFAMVLPSYGFSATEAGVRQFWRAIQPLAESDEKLKEAANTVLRKLQSSKRFEEVSDSIPERRRRISDEDSAERLSTQRATELLTELLELYNSPRFQARLNTIHRTYSPSSSAFGHSLHDLLLGGYGKILPRFGFEADEDGLLDFTMEMGKRWGDQEVQVLIGAIDDTLYGAEQVMDDMEDMMDDTLYSAEQAGTVDFGIETQDRRLRRIEVLQLLRDQVTAFGRPSFQKRVLALKEATANTRETDDFLDLPGRKDLAMIVQRKLLPKYNLPPTDFGAHSMFLQCMQFISDPEVARLTITINKLLGMEPSAAKSHVNRLRILQEDVAAPHEMRHVRRPTRSVHDQPEDVDARTVERNASVAAFCALSRQISS